ncbi:MAG: ABC transporter family substrate-binding protein [Actinomycetota bacterium]
MALRRRSALVLALLLALSLIAAACGGADDENGGVGDAEGRGESELEPVEGGTLTFGAEQEPAGNLNSDLACCNLFWGVVITNRVILNAMDTTPDFEYVPTAMLAGEPEVESEDPLTVTYSINPEAEWNDGTPITSEDFLFTIETTIDEKNDMASRAGYDQVDLEATEMPDDKTITVVFSEPYAGWKDALFNPVYPAHALEGENFNRAWTNEIVNPKTGEPIASGPFQFESYNKGADLTLVRNENWYGDHLAYLDEIVFRFILDTSAEIQALRGGEVDAIYPQPQLELVDLQAEEDITIESGAGTTWEHIDFQYGNPLLAEDHVRHAIAQGIDRQAIIDQLFADLNPDLEPLNNMIFLNNFPDYEDHFGEYGGNPEEAIALLEEGGCTREGDDGIFECDGEPLSFGFKSTAGNALRELTFEIVQEQLRQIGIEVENEFADAAVAFGNQGLAGGKYDLFLFAWVGNPDPSGSVEIHKCEGSQNYQGYCNEEATELLDESNTTIDEAERAELMNEADALMAEDLPILPMYQKPTFFAFHNKLQNAIDNATQLGPTWNAEDWFISEEGAE